MKNALEHCKYKYSYFNALTVRIHIVTPHFHPVIGGVETHVHKIAKGMVDRGHEVTIHTSIFAPDGNRLKEKENLEGISIRRYKPVIHLGYYRSLFVPKIARCDLIHMHAYGHLTNNYVTFRYKNKYPLVLTPHHGPEMPREGLLQEGMHGTYTLLTARGLNLFKRIILISECQKKWFLNKGVRKGRLVVIPNGVDDESFSEGADGVLAEYGIDRDYILYLGRLHKEKSIDHLLKAFSDLKRKGKKELKLVIVGPDAGEGTNLDALAEKLHIYLDVVFTGEVAEADKRALINNSLFLVLPSSYEAQGITILEAWAQGKGVIASKVGGLPYIVKHGKTGLLYKHGDIKTLKRLMARAVAHPSFMNNMGLRGKELAWKRYRWRTIIARTEKVYRDIAKRPCA